MNINRILNIGGVLFYLACTAAWPAEWRLSPSVRVGQEYNDNFNLTADSLAVWKTIVFGDIVSEIRSDQWSVVFDGSYRGSRYVNHSRLNQDEGFVNIVSDYSNGRFLWELDAGVILDQPSSSQLEAGNQVFDRISRLRWHIAPAWSWFWDAFTTLKASYEYNSVLYEDDPNPQTRRSDFFTHSASLELTHELSQYTQMVGIGTYIKTVNDALRFNTDQFMLQTGILHAFSDTFHVSLKAGGILLNSEVSPINTGAQSLQSTEAGFIFTANAIKRFQFTELSAEFGRFLSPTINGGQVEDTRFSFTLTHELTGLLAGNIGISARQTDSIQATVSQPGRRYLSARIGLQWDFIENWSVDAGYRYDWQKRDQNRFGAANRNSVFLFLRYRWAPLSTSG